MKRLGIETWPGVDFAPLDFDQMVPAVGQGAIAIQCREADAAKFGAVFDAATARAVTLERAFQSALGGGCHTAFAAHAVGEALYLFHETTGIRRVALTAGHFAAPAETAASVLREFGLLP
jgi:hydroxymethylbilane synthase